VESGSGARFPIRTSAPPFWVRSLRRLHSLSLFLSHSTSDLIHLQIGGTVTRVNSHSARVLGVGLGCLLVVNYYGQTIEAVSLFRFFATPSLDALTFFHNEQNEVVSGIHVLCSELNGVSAFQQFFTLMHIVNMVIVWWIKVVRPTLSAW
jgi:hypothetical protein